jgi:hypothetical protein
VLDLESLELKYPEFEWIATKEYDFFPRSFHETLPRVRGFYLVRPRSRSYQEPGEICFVYKPPTDQRKNGNDYEVVICTTKRRVGFVSKDSGWVLIVDGDGKIVYSKGPFIRTSPDFFKTLLNEGRVARWRVFYRPLRCEKYMLLDHGQALKSCLWRCALHSWDRSHNRRFDDLRKPLPPEVMEGRLAGRKERRKNREKLRKEEKDPFFAFKLRMKHPWEKKEISPSDILF